MTDRPPTHLCFLGLETTGPEPVARDFVLEVGVILTDIHLTEIVGEWATPVGTPEGLWSKRLEHSTHILNRYVRNGLVGELVAGRGMTEVQADRELTALVEPLVRPGQLALIGLDYQRDRRFIESLFWRFAAYLNPHYIDLSPIRMFMTDIANRDDLVYEPEVRHYRAADTARDYLNEARHYRQTITTSTTMEATT